MLLQKNANKTAYKHLNVRKTFKILNSLLKPTVFLKTIKNHTLPSPLMQKGNIYLICTEMSVTTFNFNYLFSILRNKYDRNQCTIFNKVHVIFLCFSCKCQLTKYIAAALGSLK